VLWRLCWQRSPANRAPGRGRPRRWQRFCSADAVRLRLNKRPSCRRLLDRCLDNRSVLNGFLDLPIPARRTADRDDDGHHENKKREHFALGGDPRGKLRRIANRLALGRSKNPLRRERLRPILLAFLTYTQRHGGESPLARAAVDAIFDMRRHRYTLIATRGARVSTNTILCAPLRTGATLTRRGNIVFGFRHALQTSREHGRSSRIWHQPPPSRTIIVAYQRACQRTPRATRGTAGLGRCPARERRANTERG
jgi:hypothetical protein